MIINELSSVVKVISHAKAERQIMQFVELSLAIYVCFYVRSRMHIDVKHICFQECIAFMYGIHLAIGV